MGFTTRFLLASLGIFLYRCIRIKINKHMHSLQQLKSAKHEQSLCTDSKTEYEMLGSSIFNLQFLNFFKPVNPFCTRGKKINISNRKQGIEAPPQSACYPFYLVMAITSMYHKNAEFGIQKPQLITNPPTSPS